MPGTFGYTTIAGTTSPASDFTWKAEALIGASNKYTAGANEAVTQFAIYASAASATTIQMAVYNWNGSAVTTMVGSAVSVNIGTTAAWCTATANIPLTSGNTYVVAANYWNGTTGIVIRFDSPGGTTISGATTTTLPATWAQQYTSGDQISFYATVSSTGNSGSPTLGDFTSSASGTVTAPNNVVYVKEVGFVTNTTTGLTSVITVAAGGVPVGDIVTVIGACDNTGSSGAATTITVTDTRGNTWATLTPIALADPGAASAGVQTFIAWTRVTTAMLAADTITVTYGITTPAKAIIAEQWTNEHTGTPILASSYVTGTQNAGTTPSVASTASAPGQAVIAAVGVEGPTSDSFTQDNDTTNGSWVGFTRRGSGTTTSAITLNAAYKIVTASGSQTYNPTLGAAADNASVIVILNVNHSGQAAPALSNFTSSVSGTVTAPAVSGDGSPTLDSFASAASGTVTAPPVSGTAAITLGPFVSVAVSTPPYPASISGRKLLDQNGKPIQLRALSSWGLAQICDNTTMTARLEAAAARGFNAVTVVMDGSNNYGTGWEKWQNAVTNETFYTGTPWSTTLGTAWTTHIGHLMRETARLGMYVIASNYPGNGSVGSKAAMIAAGTTNCRTTGQRWATFLSSWTHWILHIGADDASGADAATEVEQFCRGILDIRPGTPIVAEPAQGVDALAQWPPGSFTYFKPIEALYNYGASSVSQFETTYNGDPSTGPVWDCEPPYIGAGHYAGGAANERQNLRERHYVVPIEGGVGVNNGHEDWWPFGAAGLFSAGDTAATAMNNVSIVEFQYGWTIWDLVNTTAWGPTSSFITTGEGTGDTKAGQGTDGIRAIAYFPNNRTTVVDTTILNGTGNVSLRWYDPTAGTYSTIAASEAQSASRSVTFPSNHADGSSDYVLVVELLPIGTAAITLGAFTPAATGSSTPPPITGTSARTLGAFTSTVTGTVGQAGTAAPVLGAFAPTVTGKVGQVGTTAATLGAFAPAASGSVTVPSFTGTSARTLGPFTSTASGTVGQTGSASPTLGSFVASASGTVTTPSVTGTATPVLGSFTSATTGTVGQTGSSSPSLAPFVSAASGTSTPPGSSGTASPTLGAFVPAISGQVGQTGSASPTLGAFISTATGTSTPPAFTGTSARTLGTFTGAATGTFAPSGSGFASPTLSPFTPAATGKVGQNGTTASTLGPLTSSATGTSTPPPITGTSARTLGAFTAAALGTQGERGVVGAVLASFGATASGTVAAPPGGGDAVLAPFTATGTGKVGVNGTTTALLSPLVPAATGSVTVPAFTGAAAVILGSFVATASEAARGMLLGAQAINDMKIGTEQVTAVYFGAIRVWP